VKAQSYHLQPGMSYAGRWHVEGQTENIVAVGVYYLEINEDLTGGNLKFRPAYGPQPFYEIETDVELEVHQGSAIAFSNVIPHRFRKIVNTSQEVQRRTFLNFFIIDPSRQLRTTSTVPSTNSISRRLTQFVFERTGQNLPSPILSHIISCKIICDHC
jgi:hypothetical protein